MTPQICPTLMEEGQYCALFIHQLLPRGPLGAGAIFQAFPDEIAPGGKRNSQERGAAVSG